MQTSIERSVTGKRRDVESSANECRMLPHVHQTHAAVGLAVVERKRRRGRL